MKTQVHVIVSGRVQGVWYRASTKQKAEELGLVGWVKNTPEGDVEAVFEGDPSLVEKMVAWCRVGPPLAHVINVKINRKKSSGEFTSFTILRG